MKEVKLECRQVYFANGKIHYEEYTLNGAHHNENGYSYREWYDNGQLKYEIYKVKGLYHNENGPAYLSWHEDGRICSEYRYLNGVAYSKEQWEHQKRVNASCDGKIVEIDGKNYRLTYVDEKV